MPIEKLYNLWANRNPRWEKRYEDRIIKKFCDYGRGENALREDRGKVFGGGYEIFIVAFFIGLYSDQKRPLVEDTQRCKNFGHPIRYWGNLEAMGRTAYPKLREYIFTALVARTDIDFIALEKGEITPNKAVDMLMQTMEEYANWGFHFMEDKLIENPNHFFREEAFLEIFLQFDTPAIESIGDEPEPLD